MYADYSFYKNEYNGRLTEDEYTPLAEFAEAYIDSKTDFFFEKNGQPGDGSSLELRVKRCACVLADEKHRIDTGADRVKTSEKVGNYSVGYASTVNVTV